MSHVTASLRCNNRCVYCSQRGLDELAAPAVRPHEATVFAGGEPTLDAALPDQAAAARAAGDSPIVVQTNGRRLAYPQYTRQLIAAGVTHFEIALAGPTAAVHEYHTAAEGSYAQTVRGIQTAIREGAIVAVTTVLTRSNFRHLPALAELCRTLGVGVWHLVAARSVGAAAASTQRVVPALPMLTEFVADAAIRAERGGVRTVLTGVPLCVAGAAPSAQRREGAAFGAACDGCVARDVCGGVHAEDLAAHEPALRPLRARPVTAPLAPTWLGGIGWLGP